MTTILPPPAPVGRFVYGLEFSPNSKLLYYGVIRFGAPSGTLYQVDLSTPTAPPLLAALVPTAAGNNYSIGALQLGSDTPPRIYFARSGANAIGAILFPDTPGVGCTVTPSFIPLANGTLSQLGLPNLLPNACLKGAGCDCNCNGCNADAAAQNTELLERAKSKFFTVPAIGASNCSGLLERVCKESAIQRGVDLSPCFYFQWGDGSNDQIEEHDTEVFHITVCNRFNDIRYNGLKITKITLNPNIHPINKIQIVPDRFICIDCLEPCSCQTREFALITRATDTAGSYTLEVEYCYESISVANSGASGKAAFGLVITED